MSSERTTRRYEPVAPRRGRLVEVPLPAPGPGQFVMEVEANGICASELAAWRNGDDRQPLGHEPVGLVVERGPGVELALGQRVTGRVLGSFAERVVADAADVVAVPDGVDPRFALGEPLGCVVEAQRRTRIDVGDRVVVVGLGFMGLCLLQLLRRSPVSRLVAVDPRPAARAAAASLEADEVRHPDELQASEGHFDVAVEASGTQPGLDLATTAVAEHGVLSILGFHQGERRVDLRRWNVQAIDVVNAHVRDRRRLHDSTTRAMAMVASGGLDLRQLVTHVFALEDIDSAFTALVEKPDDFVKSVVVREI